MKREKLLQLAHIAAGIITLSYGLHCFEVGNFSTAAYYLLFAIIFMIVAGCYEWILQNFMKADIAFFLLEATTILYSGSLYKLTGHNYLFYTMAAAACLYFLFAIISAAEKEKTKQMPRKRTRKRRRRSSLYDNHQLNCKVADHSVIPMAGFKETF